MKKITCIGLLLSLVAGSEFATAKDVEKYACPWADTVIGLEFSEKRDKVFVESGLGDVPKAGWYPVEEKIVDFATFPEAGELTYFRIVSDKYVYEFAFDTTAGSYLQNRRTKIGGGKVWEQRGFCLEWHQ